MISFLTLASSIQSGLASVPGEPFPEPIGLVAVLTDYGEADYQPGALAGSIYSANPLARVAIITHGVKPFDVAEGSYILGQTAREYPPGTVFAAEVDPGVGTDRPIVVVTEDGKAFVGPDNGLFTGVMDALKMARAYEITNSSLTRPTVSSTFRGRDVYGPVAGHLSAGTRPRDVGPEIVDPVRLSAVAPKRVGGDVLGSVVYVDGFGNLVTNVPGEMVEGYLPGDVMKVDFGTVRVTVTFATTYGDVAEGEWLAIVGATGLVEVARNMESAAETIGVAAGADVRISRGV